jgi:hypothetical protein
MIANSSRLSSLDKFNMPGCKLRASQLFCYQKIFRSQKFKPEDQPGRRLRARAGCLILLALIPASLINAAYGQDSKSLLPSKPDFNRDIYYKNKLEFSLETGWLPNNIPFVFDFIVGSKYNTWPLHYTLVPNIASIRWHIDNIWGWKFLRGNTDFTFSGSYTAIPRGAETRYFAFDYGIRRNFIPPNSRIVPYFEARGGVGDINAKGPYGVAYAQGQDLTFTLMMGSGARYNFNPKYSIAAGMTYMHISNFYLSEPRYEDLGINVYGSIVGINIRLGKEKRHSQP